ncbi:MAG: carboxypeptidase-like regulatory domain-containing protein [Bacteroidota bacterium]
MKKIFLIMLIVASAINASAINEKGDEAKTKNSKSVTLLQGTVLEDVEGEKTPIQFAMVSCKGTDLNTFTDKNGEFNMQIKEPGKYTLRFSYAGYKVVEKEVDVVKSTILNCDIIKEK